MRVIREAAETAIAETGSQDDVAVVVDTQDYVDELAIRFDGGGAFTANIMLLAGYGMALDTLTSVTVMGGGADSLPIYYAAVAAVTGLELPLVADIVAQMALEATENSETVVRELNGINLSTSPITAFGFIVEMRPANSQITYAEE
ncbi:MAG: hypothetical protein LBE35_02190 [Clostridiales bacterium]|nr:hypothetical protein [Clostridiales bacterium]